MFGELELSWQEEIVYHLGDTVYRLGQLCRIMYRLGHFWKTSNKYDLVVSSGRRLFFRKDQKILETPKPFPLENV